MGYTHYFSLQRNKKTGLKTLKKNVDKILKEHADIVQFESDVKKPTVCQITGNDILIRFNGIGNNGYETFYFDSNELEFNFCKTARKNYDIVVCKVLIELQQFYGTAIDVSSDGFSGFQPKDEKLKIGDIVENHNLDGVWGDAKDYYNNKHETQLIFKVIDVYGTGGCYFKYALVKK